MRAQRATTLALTILVLVLVVGACRLPTNVVE